VKMASLVRIGIIMAACVFALCFAAEEPKNTTADAAWTEVLKALRPPPPPPEWRTNQPTKEQIVAYERANGELAGAAADKVRSFYLKYPSHPNARNAREMEPRLLATAVELGATNRQLQLDELRQMRLQDPDLSAEEKFELRLDQIVRLVSVIVNTGSVALLEKAEKDALELHRDFPKREETGDVLLRIGDAYIGKADAKAQQVFDELVKTGSADAKQQAERQIRTLKRLGNHLDLIFTDIRGDKIDISNYGGKVVVVDFWATWCGPCVAALPELKDLYEKWHAKGLEILGVNLDKEREKLEDFVTERNISWPQYFDGLGWDNRFAQQFEISAIPTLWIIDKKGNLRDIKGRELLAAKVERLLAE
jgi:thiol-disulfide isomerase/thioredoxin